MLFVSLMIKTLKGSLINYGHSAIINSYIEIPLCPRMSTVNVKPIICNSKRVIHINNTCNFRSVYCQITFKIHFKQLQTVEGNVSKLINMYL